MDHFLILILLLLFVTSLFSCPFVLIAESPSPIISRISVVGAVYCDTCSTSTFSKQSYFLQGVEVHIQCRFRATSPKTNEQISFSVNRTTDQYGVYKLDIPSVDGVNCMDGSAIVSLCQATLIRSSTSTCNVPFLKSTTREISVKSKQDNLCVYTLSGLSYKPPQKNTTLCGDQKEQLASSLNSSKFYFPWPQLPFPPFPSLPFPPLPFPTSPPIPSLPFPFPQYPPTPSAFSPPPFNLEDPTTWIPRIPSLSHPPPPPPAFNLGDPSTWIPHIPPSPPNIPQHQNP
ncbi:Pollen-specific protein [Spatholobus suberectus]|nr:Pollen-specific protein [Spatholobus suberectus]